MTSFKDKIKTFYNDKNLSSAQVEGLKMILDENSRSKNNFTRSRPVWIGGVIGVVAAAALAVFLLMPSLKSIDGQIAQEMAMNHNKHMKLDVLSGSIDDIYSGLNKLDFQIIKPKRFIETAWKIVGGRYCSIQGQIAVQLRLEDRKTGKQYTVYQTRWEKDWPQSKVDGFKQEFDGVVVEMWMEKGLLVSKVGP